MKKVEQNPEDVMTAKKRFFANHSRSSALVITVILHAVLAITALSFVVVKIIIKDDQTFVVKKVNRPRIKLKKLTVPIKMEKRRVQKPKLRKTIIVKKELKLQEIRMPEITGIKGGTGYLNGGGGLGSLGFGFELPDFFGSNRRGNGNEFIGHFYDLKLAKDGLRNEIGDLVARAKSTDFTSDPDLIESSRLYREALEHFLGGWSPSRLKRFFMAPREKYATSFMIPLIDAAKAPEAFGVQKKVKPMKWVALYQGQIAAPESGKYRLVGRGDDILVVRVKKRVVLDASYTNITGWEGKDPNNRKFEIYGSPDFGGAVIGDWFHLEKGRVVPMEVLIGEDPGVGFFTQLFIQQEGVEYPTRTETYINPTTHQQETIQRPILPIFKTTPLKDEVVAQMQINGNWATAEGPDFGVIKK